MPAALWPRMFRWLRELCDDWGCHLVLASGSLARFWELEEFVPTSARRPIPELVSTDVANRTKEFEEERVHIRTHSDKLSLPKLAEFVLSKPGPRLVILNTVQSAAVLARPPSQRLQARPERRTHFHRADATGPGRDRAARTRAMASPWKGLVSGGDQLRGSGSGLLLPHGIPRKLGPREPASNCRTRQPFRRVSSTPRCGTSAMTNLADFHCIRRPTSRAKFWRTSSPVLCDSSSASLRPAIAPKRSGWSFGMIAASDVANIEKIERAEKAADYPEVAKLCRIITADTQTVLVDQELAKRIESRDRTQFPSWRDIMQNSVQIWASRVDPRKLPVQASWTRRRALALDRQLRQLPRLHGGCATIAQGGRKRF